MDNESTLRIFSGTLHVLRDIHFLCDVVFINLTLFSNDEYVKIIKYFHKNNPKEHSGQEISSLNGRDSI